MHSCKRTCLVDSYFWYNGDNNDASIEILRLSAFPEGKKFSVLKQCSLELVQYKFHYPNAHFPKKLNENVVKYRYTF